MKSSEKAELARRVGDRAFGLLKSCWVCPRKCGVNRLEGERGFCRMGAEIVVSSTALHHGEEPPLSGTGGSGTIFFTGCNLKCLFCQNYPISQLDEGRVVAAEELAERVSILSRPAYISAPEPDNIFERNDSVSPGPTDITLVNSPTLRKPPLRTKTGRGEATPES